MVYDPFLPFLLGQGWFGLLSDGANGQVSRFPGPFRGRPVGGRPGSGALLTLLIGMTALNGVEYLVPQYLQAVAGQSPLEAGLWLLPGAAGLIAGSQLTPVLARRFRPAYVLAGGLLLSLPGYAAIALYEGVLTASLGLTVIMFGVAPISVLGAALAVGAAPAEKAGAAAATGQTA